MENSKRRYTADEQYEMVIECRSSGLTDYQWCMEHGINMNTFHSWVKRLKTRHHRNVPRRYGCRTIDLPPVKQDIVRIDVVDDTVADDSVPVVKESLLPSSTQCDTPAIKIQVPGIDISVSNHADPSLVSHILRSIGGGLC